MITELSYAIPPMIANGRRAPVLLRLVHDDQKQMFTVEQRAQKGWQPLGMGKQLMEAFNLMHQRNRELKANTVMQNAKEAERANAIRRKVLN